MVCFSPYYLFSLLWSIFLLWTLSLLYSNSLLWSISLVWFGRAFSPFSLIFSVTRGHVHFSGLFLSSGLLSSLLFLSSGTFPPSVLILSSILFLSCVLSFSSLVSSSSHFSLSRVVSLSPQFSFSHVVSFSPWLLIVGGVRKKVGGTSSFQEPHNDRLGFDCRVSNVRKMCECMSVCGCVRENELV